jgi:hypothetical protein
VCNVFLMCEPLRGWRQVTVSARRTRIDWAHCIKDLWGAKTLIHQAATP